MVVKELVALLGIKTDPKSQKQAEGGMNKLIGLAKTAAAAFAALKIVGFLKGIIEGAAALGDRFDKLSKRTGVAAGELQGLEHAAELSGASLRDIEVGIKTLQRAQIEAKDGVATYSDEFDRMGLSITNADGSLKDTTQLLIEMGDGLKGLKTDAERTAVASQLLGRGGAKLIPMFKDGSAALREMVMEMAELGGVMDDDMIQASADFVDAQRRIDVSILGVKNAIAKEMLPQINKLTDAFIAWWKINGAVIRQRMTEFFGKLGRGISRNVKFWTNLAKKVGNFLADLDPLQKKLLGLVGVIALIGAAISAGPIGKILLLGTFIAILIDDFQTFKEGGVSAFGHVLKKAYEFLGIDPAQANYEQWSQDIDTFTSGAASMFDGLFSGLLGSMAETGSMWSAWLAGDEAALKASTDRQVEIWDASFASIALGLDKLFGADFPRSTREAYIAFTEMWQGLPDWFKANFIDAVINDLSNFGSWFKTNFIDVISTDLSNFVAWAKDLLPEWLQNWMGGKTPKLPTGAPAPAPAASPGLPGPYIIPGGGEGLRPGPFIIPGGGEGLRPGPFLDVMQTLASDVLTASGSSVAGARAVAPSSAGGSITSNQTNTTQIDVHPSPGMDEAALASKVQAVVKQENDRNNRATMRALTPEPAAGVG